MPRRIPFVCLHTRLTKTDSDLDVLWTAMFILGEISLFYRLFIMTATEKLPGHKPSILRDPRTSQQPLGKDFHLLDCNMISM